VCGANYECSLSSKHDFGLYDMVKKNQLSFFDLDIKNSLGRGTFAKFEFSLHDHKRNLPKLSFEY
jgi:hypothetical protein